MRDGHLGRGPPDVHVQRRLAGLVGRRLEVVEGADHAHDLAVHAHGLELALVQQLDVLHDRLAGEREADHLRQVLALAVKLGDEVALDDHVVGRDLALLAELQLDRLVTVDPVGLGDLHVLHDGLVGRNRADHAAALEVGLAKHAGQLLLDVVEPEIAIAADGIRDPQSHSRLQRRGFTRRTLQQLHR